MSRILASPPPSAPRTPSARGGVGPLSRGHSAGGTDSSTSSRMSRWSSSRSGSRSSLSLRDPTSGMNTNVRRWHQPSSRRRAGRAWSGPASARTPASQGDMARSGRDQPSPRRSACRARSGPAPSRTAASQGASVVPVAPVTLEFHDIPPLERLRQAVSDARVDLYLQTGAPDAEIRVQLAPRRRRPAGTAGGRFASLFGGGNQRRPESERPGGDDGPKRAEGARRQLASAVRWTRSHLPRLPRRRSAAVAPAASSDLPAEEGAQSGRAEVPALEAR